MIPIICIVGKSNSGKTSLMQQLIARFKGQGYRVATIKHTPHDFSLDVSGKDSWRLLKAGGDLVMISGPEGVAQFKASQGDTPLETLVEGLEASFDLVLAEGYKDSPFPKVEVHRSDLGPDLVCRETQLTALVSDMPPKVTVRTFRTSETTALAAFLEQTYLKPLEGEESIGLVINEQAVPLNAFASSVFIRGILGMASALKGTEQVETLQLTIKAPAQRKR